MCAHLGVFVYKCVRGVRVCEIMDMSVYGHVEMGEM